MYINKKINLFFIYLNFFSATHIRWKHHKKKCPECNQVSKYDLGVLDGGSTNCNNCGCDYHMCSLLDPPATTPSDNHNVIKCIVRPKKKRTSVSTTTTTHAMSEFYTNLSEQEIKNIIKKKLTIYEDGMSIAPFNNIQVPKNDLIFINYVKHYKIDAKTCKMFNYGAVAEGIRIYSFYNVIVPLIYVKPSSHQYIYEIERKEFSHWQSCGLFTSIKNAESYVSDTLLDYTLCDISNENSLKTPSSDFRKRTVMESSSSDIRVVKIPICTYACISSPCIYMKATHLTNKRKADSYASKSTITSPATKKVKIATD